MLDIAGWRGDGERGVTFHLLLPRFALSSWFFHTICNQNGRWWNWGSYRGAKEHVEIINPRRCRRNFFWICEWSGAVKETTFDHSRSILRTFIHFLTSDIRGWTRMLMKGFTQKSPIFSSPIFSSPIFSSSSWATVHCWKFGESRLSNRMVWKAGTRSKQEGLGKMLGHCPTGKTERQRFESKTSVLAVASPRCEFTFAQNAYLCLCSVWLPSCHSKTKHIIFHEMCSNSAVMFIVVFAFITTSSWRQNLNTGGEWGRGWAIATGGGETVLAATFHPPTWTEG